MEWVFDADRRIERLLGFPGISTEETVTDILHIIVDLQIHEDGTIIRAGLPISYTNLEEVEDFGFMIYIAIKMSIGMCLNHAREKGDLE